MWRRCVQMFFSALAFNQNLASWNTASVSNMFRVRSAQWHARRLVTLRRRLEQLVLSLAASAQLCHDLDGLSGLRLHAAAAHAARALASLRYHALGRHALGAMRRRCAQMFSFASAFNQNLASWNTASVLSMTSVRSVPIACARAG